MTNFKAYASAHAEELHQLLRALCRIPAPSHFEDARAVFCKRWLEQNGCGAVRIVREDNDLVLLMAHTDTVFPDKKPMPLQERGGRIFCPGVGDDTANLAILLFAARYFARCGKAPAVGVLFVANACEEGLGNLDGSRALMDAYGRRLREVISFDLGFDTLVTRAVGSARYRITVRTAGGHSYGNFGNRSAVHAAAELICALYDQPVPQSHKTTFNVGKLTGGTSVNTIPEQAELLYEYRSESAACMAQMQRQFEAVLARFNVRGARLKVEQIGLRPGMGTCRDEKRQAALTARAEQVLTRVMGAPPVQKSGSTDCNIPFSMGIPSVSFGLVDDCGAHTRHESVALVSLPRGLEAALRFIAPYFGLPVFD